MMICFLPSVAGEKDHYNPTQEDDVVRGSRVMDKVGMFSKTLI